MSAPRPAPKGVPFHAGIGCGLDEIHIGGDAVVLVLPRGHCTDMEGAIALGKAAHPDVRLVATYSGDALDTCYGRMDDGTWSVIDGRKLLGESA